MTEIEKELFEKYGVESRTIFSRCKNGIDFYKDCTNNCKNCLYAIYETTYPPITPEIVLGLIEFIINKAKKDDEEKIDFIFTTDKYVKTQIIGGMLKTYECFTPQEQNEIKKVLEG